jgi:hypothetical protein
MIHDKIIIFTPKKIYKYYYQFVEALINSFNLLGYSTNFINEIKEKFNPNEKILLIILADPTHKDTKLICDYNNQENITTVLYETEAFKRPSHIKRRYGIYNIDYLWTYSHIVVDNLTNYLNCPIFYLPPGYSPIYNYISDTNINQEPITLVNNNSKKRLASLRNHIPNINNISGCWTHQSFKIINKYNMLINIHKIGRNALEMFRIAPFLSSGFNIISEHSYCKDENEYKDFITFLNVSEIPQYLEKQSITSNEEKLNIKKDISRRFEEKFNLTNTLENILKKMNI